MWDFIFYQNGAVEAKVHATGYISSSFLVQDGLKHGHQVAPGVLGNIHTHFINFKADLDVLGVENMFQTKDMEFRNVSLPWMPEHYAMVPHLVEKTLHTEQAALRHGIKTPRYLLQVYSFAGDHLPESQPEERSMSWARYKVAITKHKDLEQTSSSLYSQNNMWSPAVDFSTFIQDDESIHNQVSARLPIRIFRPDTAGGKGIIHAVVQVEIFASFLPYSTIRDGYRHPVS
uniref:Amine oxidase n=1 Tax=Neogobius melanostomus TaxID=47308 RepID=A0A8C6WZ79_9GOBI